MEEFHLQYCGAILIGFMVSVVMIRLAYVLYWSGRPLRSLSQRVSTLIVLGSGGHTAEMLSIVNVLEKDRFVLRFYIAAGTDNMSLQKARVMEESLVQEGEIPLGLIKGRVTHVMCPPKRIGKVERKLKPGRIYKD